MVISTNAGESKPSGEIGEATIDFSKLFIALKDCEKTEKIVKYLTDNSETYLDEFGFSKFCEANPLGL